MAGQYDWHTLGLEDEGSIASLPVSSWKLNIAYAGYVWLSRTSPKYILRRQSCQFDGHGVDDSPNAHRCSE